MMCEPSAYFIARSADRQSQLCSICAELCHQCVEECLRFAEDAQMMACAEACRRALPNCIQRKIRSECAFRHSGAIYLSQINAQAHRIRNGNGKPVFVREKSEQAGRGSIA